MPEVQIIQKSYPRMILYSKKYTDVESYYDYYVIDVIDTCIF